MFSPSSPSSYMMFHLVSNDFKATVLKGGFSHLLQLWTLNCFDGIKLVSKHLRILALHKSVALFWLAHNDKSTSSVVIAPLNGHDQVSVWGKLFIIYLLTKQHPWKWSAQCSARTFKTHLAMEKKSEEQGEKCADSKMDYICPSLQNFCLCEGPDYAEDNFRAEMRCSVGGRDARCQLLQPYLGFCGSCKSCSCRERKVHWFRSRSMT